jgi:hypothetical protein
VSGKAGKPITQPGLSHGCRCWWRARVCHDMRVCHEEGRGLLVGVGEGLLGGMSRENMAAGLSHGAGGGLAMRKQNF